jgi:hypothetical protein
MTRDPQDALLQATLEYRARFGQDVWTWTMDPARVPAVCSAMRAAIERGVPLSIAEAVTGVGWPPPGTLA